MGNQTKIDWTDATWNPIVGCRKESPGCQNCYAETMAARLAAMRVKGYSKVVGANRKWNGKTSFINSALNKPFGWKKPRKIFVCSMGDLFCWGVPFKQIKRVLQVISKTPQHQYQVLTKRPALMEMALRAFPLFKNLWCGVSAENQTEADNRIPDLLNTRASLRFISVEPMLGPVDLSKYIESLDWVICGGESGPNARPMHPDWARNLRDQCAAAGGTILL